MSLQTCKTFICLQTAIFDEIQELYEPCIDINATTRYKAQKGSKNIIKIVHVTAVVQP